MRERSGRTHGRALTEAGGGTVVWSLADREQAAAQARQVTITVRLTSF
jgi:hypothetical protein